MGKISGPLLMSLETKLRHMSEASLVTTEEDII